MAQKDVQWIDTNNKPYYLSYQMPLSISNRCWFFWANIVEGWRKVLNRANALAFGYKVSFVFLYGKIDTTVTNYIKKLNNPQMVVLSADYISADHIKVISEAEEWLARIQKWGGRAQDENKQWAWDVSQIFLDGVAAFESRKTEYERFLLAKSHIGEIRAAVEQKGYRVLSDLQQKTVAGSQEGIVVDLLAIIKELYPYGIEADTNSEFAYKRLAVKKMIALGAAGETDDTLIKNCGIRMRKDIGVVQLSFLDDYSDSAMRIVTLIRETYRHDIERMGYCSSGALWAALVRRPYGYYDCNYYCYIIAFALSVFNEGYYTISRYIWQKFDPKSLSTYEITPLLFIQTDKQKSLVNKICKLFDIDEPVETLFWALSKARRWAENHIHYDSIDRVSHDLYLLVRDNDSIQTYSFETEKYDDWLDEKTIEELHSKLQTVDENYFQMLVEKYGEKRTTLFKKYFYIKGSVGGWLWESKYIDQTVEEYMNKIICRECGRVLNPCNEDYCYQVSQYIDGNMETHDFTLKQIQGLNKKFFGRYQTDYYCIPCMAEILGITEWELWERMHEFKEQGCTLF